MFCTQVETGDECMKEVNIVFRNPEEVQEFITIASKYPYNMDMKRGAYMIDAKSILGILSLGVGQRMKLQILEDNCEELVYCIRKFCTT